MYTANGGGGWPSCPPCFVTDTSITISLQCLSPFRRFNWYVLNAYAQTTNCRASRRDYNRGGSNNVLTTRHNSNPFYTFFSGLFFFFLLEQYPEKLFFFFCDVQGLRVLSFVEDPYVISFRLSLRTERNSTFVGRSTNLFDPY